MADYQNKDFFNEKNIGKVSFDEKTLRDKLNLWISLFSKPMTVMEVISQNAEIDMMQIILTTLIATLVGIVTNGLTGLGAIIGMPIAIALGGVFLLIVTLIAGGKTDYIKLLNFSAYLALITTLSGLLARVPIVAFAAGITASIYCIYLQYIGLPYITGGKKETIKVICIVQLCFVGVIVLGGILGMIGYFLFWSSSLLNF